MIRLTPLAASLALAGLSILAVTARAQSTGTTAEKSIKTDLLPEVVVTAQKRVQATSKVPLSLSVVSDVDIKSQGIATAANLTELVPNVSIGSGNNGGMEITIRGIGNGDNSERGDPQAAFHVDGIYLGRPQGAGATFFDLDRVEVLRGPQGTLYGRNANAGAINVITRKPTPKLEGEFGVEIGTYGAKKIEGVLNVPVSDSFAMRAVVSSQKHDGYSDTANAQNGFSKNRDDQDNQSGRVIAQLKISPSAIWAVTLDGSQNKGAGQQAFDVTSGVPVSRIANPQVAGRVDNKSNGLTSDLKFAVGDFEVAYLFGRRASSRDEQTSFGSSPSVYSNYSDSYSQDSHELRLSSDSTGLLQWVTGLYSFKETGNNIDLDVLLPPQFGGGRAIHFVQNPTVSESSAAFGQMTYSVSNDSRVTVGIRSTLDHKSRTGETRVGPFDAPIGQAGNNADAKWSKLTYKLGAEYDLGKTEMVFANLATGYKAGGFNDGNAVQGDPNYNPSLYYQPETIESFEAGLKGRYLNNRLQVALSGFYYNYSDLQKSAVVNNSLNTLNAAKATVKGIEAEGKLVVTESGRINFALGYLDASYDNYTTPNGQNFAGQALDRAPKLTLNLGYTHDFDLDSGARVTLHAGTRYTSSYILSDTGTSIQAPRVFTQDATTKSEVTATYTSADEKLSLQLFAKNLEDKSSLASILTLNGSNYAYLTEPRTVGLRAMLRF